MKLRAIQITRKALLRTNGDDLGNGELYGSKVETGGGYFAISQEDKSPMGSSISDALKRNAELRKE